MQRSERFGKVRLNSLSGTVQNLCPVRLKMYFRLHLYEVIIQNVMFYLHQQPHVYILGNANHLIDKLSSVGS